MDEKETETLEKGVYETWCQDNKSVIAQGMEIGIDKLMADGLGKDIPIVNTVMAIVKTGFSIRDRNFMKKLFEFLNASKIDRSSVQFEQFIKKLEKKDKNKLAEVLIEIIDKTTESVKIPMYAKLLDSVIEEGKTFDDFYNLSLCLYNLHPLGIALLKEIIDKKPEAPVHTLDQDKRESFIISAGLASRYGGATHINEFGKNLYHYCIKD